MVVTEKNRRLECFIAQTDEMIIEAQKLRYHIFAEEMGAQLQSGADKLDHDEYDPYCDHLIVFDRVHQKIAGYTRLLPQHQAERLGRFYSQSEFDLGQILQLPGKFLEIGRTCVHPEYRGGIVLSALWSYLMQQYVQKGGFNYLMGCASIPAGPHGFSVDAVYRSIAPNNFSPENVQARPLHPVPENLRNAQDECGIPPLLKAYLRFGVWVCGQPSYDPDFNVMDLFILLPINGIPERYTNHYVKPATLPQTQYDLTLALGV